MSVVNSIKLEMAKPVQRQSISVRCGDTNSRQVRFTLARNGVVYDLSKAIFAVVKGKKPDNTEFFNDCQISGNEVFYNITTQTVAVAGDVLCELEVAFDDGSKITSPEFVIYVYQTQSEYGAESQNEYQGIMAALSVAKQAENGAVSSQTAARTYAERAENYAAAASESASEAAISESNAAASEQAVEDSAAAADASATAAANSATTAAESESAAAGSATAADESATAAASSATDAAGSATAAASSATEAAGYESGAETSATAAAGSASDAADSATAAAGSATAAASSATDAAGSATVAANSATAAAGSESAAASSAMAAAGSATAAASSATDAAGSATAAANSATTAAGHESAAGTSATAAAGSASAAVNSATAAAGSASAAAGSATAAAGSASDAEDAEEECEEILSKIKTYGVVLGTTHTDAGYGDESRAAYLHSQVVSGNPHGVTKSDVGLGNVDNTSDLNKPVSSAQSAINTTLNGNIGTLANLNTSAKGSAVAAINEVNGIAKGRNQAISYNNYQSMVTALNAAAKTAFSRGQNIYIRTLGVPDLWIYSVENTSVSYTYTTDAAIENALKTGTVQMGYYKLSQLETQKVDLTTVNNRLTALETAVARIGYPYTPSAS